MEEKASGIDVEQTELESLLEEILEREKEAKKDLELKDRDKKSKVEKEKATAEEVRNRARGADFQVGGLTRTRKREPTRGVRGHAPPGKFEILFFWNG